MLEVKATSSVELPRISIIIPARGNSNYLETCLTSVGNAVFSPFECIVVADGADPLVDRVARSHAALSLWSTVRAGPAHARNLGVQSASGEILLFLDADVCIRPDTLSKIASAFDSDPSLAAIIGSYDATPKARDFLSLYRNLHHHYIHQRSETAAVTFWTGCGAMRKATFYEFGGFDERYRRPSTEDVELGFRLAASGRKILLDKKLVVTHLKHWNLKDLIKCDLFDRAIPWTDLILRFGRLPNDLNFRVDQRVSVALVAFSVVLAGAAMVEWTLAPLGFALFCMLATSFVNLRFYRFLASREGLWFALRAVPAHAVYFLCSGVGFSLGLLRSGARLLPRGLMVLREKLRHIGEHPRHATSAAERVCNWESQRPDLSAAVARPHIGRGVPGQQDARPAGMEWSR